MFNEQEPQVVTEKDVGDYIKELESNTKNPLEELLEDTDGMAGDSEEPSDWTESASGLPTMRGGNKHESSSDIPFNEIV